MVSACTTSWILGLCCVRHHTNASAWYRNYSLLARALAHFSRSPANTTLLHAAKYPFACTPPACSSGLATRCILGATSHPRRVASSSAKPRGALVAVISRHLRRFSPSMRGVRHRRKKAPALVFLINVMPGKNAAVDQLLIYRRGYPAPRDEKAYILPSHSRPPTNQWNSDDSDRAQFQQPCFSASRLHVESL